MKKFVLLVFVLVLLSMSMLGTQLIITVSGSTTHHVYLGQSIQEAIDSAQSGDTIVVHSGTYYESLVVDKTVSLVGENQNTTIIRSPGGPEDYVVHISADDTSISEFTIWGRRRSILVLRHPTEPENVVYGVKIHDVVVIGGYMGVQLHHCKESIICNNTFLNSTYAGIDLLFSSENDVLNNRVSFVYWMGICLEIYSNSNRIVGNIIEFNNHDGIVLGQSYDNIIKRNLVLNHSRYGIRVSGEDNKIFHNNFINNTNQVYSYNSTNIWDNGYPSGGNYWSDYNGTDLYSGPNQNETGSDGIGDISYAIDENNKDNYPLMGMFSDFKVNWEEETYHINLISNSTVLNSRFEEVIALDNHSTQEVITGPEFPTWTSLLLILIVLTVTIAIYKRRLLKTPTH